MGIKEAFKRRVLPPEERKANLREEMLGMTKYIMKTHQIVEKLQLRNDRQKLFESYFAGYYTKGVTQEYQTSNSISTSLTKKLSFIPSVRRILQKREDDTKLITDVADTFLEEANKQANTINESAIIQARENLQQQLQEIFVEEHAKQHPEYQAYADKVQNEAQLDASRSLLKEYGTPKVIEDAAKSIAQEYLKYVGRNVIRHEYHMKRVINDTNVLGF